MASTYIFLLSFYDRDADIDRELSCTVYVNEKGKTTHISMYNVKTRKMFLKKIPVDSLRNTTQGLCLKDFYLGANVTVLGRQYEVVKYCNAATKAALEGSRGAQSAIIGSLSSGAGFGKIGSALSHFAKCGQVVRALRLVEKGGEPSCVVTVVGKNSGDAIAGAAEYGVSSISDEEATALFASPTTETLDHCSLCIIKPHAIRSGNAGHILTRIVAAGFEISAMKMCSLSRIQAEELLEVYKVGVMCLGRIARLVSRYTNTVGSTRIYAHRRTLTFWVAL